MELTMTLQERIEELIKWAEHTQAVHPTPWCLGHKWKTPEVFDVGASDYATVAESRSGDAAFYLVTFNPAFMLKLLKSYGELSKCLQQDFVEQSQVTCEATGRTLFFKTPASERTYEALARAAKILGEE
jgi:hypothetical protein